MATEVRYIIFTPDDVRAAIILFLQKQGRAVGRDVVAVEFSAPGDPPSALVRLQTGEPTKLSEQYLIAALLLYCFDRRIPIPKQAAKRLVLTIDGLTLEMTSDRAQGSPLVGHNQVSYGELATRATQTIGSVQEQLARAVARADHAERCAAEAEDRARKAELARGRSSARLTAVALVPGLRGRIGRWLVRFRPPYADECV